MACEEIKKAEIIEKLKIRHFLQKTQSNPFLSGHVFHTISEKIEIEKVTLYAVEAHKIAANWKKSEKKSNF